ncbi:hypothetical protein [Sorangium sp. So ce542]|uniref:hypothetical protein n=1 Tax=Sorangium sp. So ce542 TaxID=3133316 RepID=UPI003F609C19
MTTTRSRTSIAKLHGVCRLATKAPAAAANTGETRNVVRALRRIAAIPARAIHLPPQARRSEFFEAVCRRVSPRERT